METLHLVGSLNQHNYSYFSCRDSYVILFYVMLFIYLFIYISFFTKGVKGVHCYLVQVSFFYISVSIFPSKLLML